jgi:protein ImuB
VSHRVACVDVPALPLQLLERARPSWRGAPLAVIEEDHPQALLLWIDAAAAQKGVRIGMRYAAALQLCRDLRAAPVRPAMIEEAVQELVTLCMGFSPKVEPDEAREGVFWLDPTGLGTLFGPLERWAGEVHAALSARALRGAVVVGFARLPTWAVARMRAGPFVLESPAEEEQLAAQAPLALVEVPPELRDALVALGITTLGGFLKLPRGDVGQRFGPEARTLHALFADALRPPMQAVPPPAPVRVEAELEAPDDDLGRLLFFVKGGLHALMSELARRALALSAVEVRLELERAPPVVERVEPARATRDAVSVLELLRLRLGRVALASRVERIVLEATPSRPIGTQLSLFAGRRRDPDAAARGIARLRASFGAEAVTRAALIDAWRPERAFAWEPTDGVDEPRVKAPGGAGLLVRRLLPEPLALPSGPDGRPRTDPPLEALTGPYRLQGGFWAEEWARDYFYGERRDGALLWLFRDRASGRWYLHGKLD